MKIYHICITVLLILCLFLSTGCAEFSKTNQELIQGKWTNISYHGEDGVQVTYEFYEDGTLIIDNKVVAGDVQVSGPTFMDFNYAFSGDSRFRVDYNGIYAQKAQKEHQSSVFAEYEIIELNRNELILKDSKTNEQIYFKRES